MPSRLVLTLLLTLPFFGSLTTARADTASDTLQMPTDGIATHLFPVNPAVVNSKGFRFALLGVNDTRSSTLDQAASGGGKISSAVSDAYLGAAANIDLGAGAGLVLTHELQFHKVATTMDSVRRSLDQVELAKIQEDALKLGVELTDALHAAISVRYLEEDNSILGDLTLGSDMRTRYVSTFIGYGSGFTYTAKTAGIGYSYFPPLHGKTVIEGQQELVVNPGFVAVDGYWQPARIPGLTLAVLAKRWLNEFDDLAVGTTASDNKTKISLHGLDPDQYVIHDQLLMAGADYAFNKQMAIRLGVGQEHDHFDFRNQAVYTQIQVKAQGLDGMNSTRERAAIRFSNQGLDLEGGIGVFNRKYGFNSVEGSANYSATGQEIFVTITARL